MTGPSTHQDSTEVPEQAVERLADELLLYRFGGHFSNGEYFVNRPEQGTQKLLERLRRGGFEEYEIKLTESGHDFIVCLDAMEILAAETLQ